MNTLNLNKMGLAPMQTCELQEVDGGNQSIVGYAIGWIVGKTMKVADQIAETVVLSRL